MLNVWTRNLKNHLLLYNYEDCFFDHYCRHFLFRWFRSKKLKVSAPKRTADNSDIEIIVIGGKQDSANKEKVEQVTSTEMAKEVAATQCEFFPMG